MWRIFFTIIMFGLTGFMILFIEIGIDISENEYFKPWIGYSIMVGLILFCKALTALGIHWNDYD